MAAVPGSRAYLAVVADGGDALVYVCDGDGVGQALSGRIQGGRLEAAVEGVQLTGTLTATGIAGQLTLPGSAPVTFTAPPAVEGRTGLYRSTKSVNGTEYVSWWIRSDQGLKGTATTVGGKAGFDAETAATTLMNGC